MRGPNVSRALDGLKPKDEVYDVRAARREIRDHVAKMLRAARLRGRGAARRERMALFAQVILH